MSRSTAASDTAPSPRRSPRVAARARAERAVRAAQPPHADGTGLVVAPREGSPRRAILLLLWLGWVHVNWAIMLACLAALPLPYALGALLAWVAINNAPVPEARAEEGGALALEVTRNAEAYHRITPVFVARAELEAACAEGPVLFAYAPHVVLPTCVAAFTYGGPVRRALHHLETIANMRVLASSMFMWIPGLHHLWRFMGGSPVSRQSIDAHLAAGRSLCITPGGVSEALRVSHAEEVLYLRRRYGFVKAAARRGAAIVPTFAFGQRDVYSWWIPFAGTRWLNYVSRRLHVVPMFYWGRFGSRAVALAWLMTTVLAVLWSSVAIAAANLALGLALVYPHRQPVTVVIGAPITTTDIGAAPSRSQVRQKLDEVVNAMETLYYEHRVEHGDERLELRIE